MLSDKVIEQIDERLLKRIEAGNEYVLKMIGKKLKKIKSLSPSEANKLINILKYGGDYEKIANKLAQITAKNTDEIHKIFNEVAKKDYEFDEQFYKYRNIEYPSYDKNTELKRLVESIAEITAKEYQNIAGLSKSVGLGVVNDKGEVVFKPLKEAYNQLIDEAILNISTGKETMDTMMKRTLNELDQGLKVIYEHKDEDGNIKYYKKRIDSAVRETINGGLSKLQQEMQVIVGRQFKSDGVEITVVYNPAPDHEKVQGKQFSNDEFEKFQNDLDCHSYDGVFFPAVSEETKRDRRSIGQYNCRHLVYSIILGVNEQQYTNDQLKKIIDDNHKGFDFEGKHYSKYEGSQLQRKLESEIRAEKLNQISARARNDQEAIYKSQEKITTLTNKYKSLCNAGNLTKYDDRLRVSGYHRVKVKRPVNSPPKPVADLKYNALEQPKESKIAVKDNKFYNSSRVFKASKSQLDLSNDDNINIYNATDKLNITIYERANIKKAKYNRNYKQITTTSVNQKDIDNKKPTAVLWHELGHALDNYKGGDNFASNTESMRTKMYEFYQNNKTIPQEVVSYFKGFKERTDAEYEKEHPWDDYYEHFIENKEKAGASEYNLKVYRDNKEKDIDYYNQIVEREYKYEKRKLYTERYNYDMEYNQLLNFSDMFSAISKGKYNKDFCGNYGWHSISYFEKEVMNPTTELFANFVSLKMTGCKNHLKFFKEVAPEIYDELDQLYKQIGGDLNAK